MKVKVKCPKCRLTYETDAIAGENEIACVCPRCGTPFTFSIGPAETPRGEIDSSNQNQKGMDNTIPTHPVNHPVAGREYHVGPVDVQNKTHVESHVSDSSLTPPPIPPRKGPVLNDQRIPPHRRNGGCIKGCIIFIIIFALAFFLVGKSIHNGENNHPVELFDTNDSSEVLSPSAVDLNNEGSEEIPSWLEGIWYGEADYGMIVLGIHQNQITIKVGQKMKSGTFRYEDDILYIDFDGKNHEYHTNESNHSIYTGDGIRLIKE